MPKFFVIIISQLESPQFYDSPILYHKPCIYFEEHNLYSIHGKSDPFYLSF